MSNFLKLGLRIGLMQKVFSEYFTGIIATECTFQYIFPAGTFSDPATQTA